MSKKSRLVNPSISEPASWGHGYMYFPYQTQDLEGKLLTLAETLGLKDTQEKSYKDMIRTVLYGFFNEARYVDTDTANKVMEQDAQVSASVPRS